LWCQKAWRQRMRKWKILTRVKTRKGHHEDKRFVLWAVTKNTDIIRWGGVIQLTEYLTVTRWTC
jgi:hypothetical protein